jgi:uncharacterized membrane protein YgdD (TMEM256/DUF423 family)
MPQFYRRCLISAAVLAALAVALGAFAAHGLKGQLSPRMLAAFITGSDYQMTHALGLMLAAWMGQQQSQNPWFRRACLAFIIGILLFCGSLYIMALSGIAQLGIITPFGGVSMLIAWVSLAMAFYQFNK